MKKKLLCGIISFTMLVSSSSIVFAGEAIDGEQIIAEHQADVVEEIVGTEDVSTDMEESRNEFTVEGEGVDISIPKDGDDEIVLESEGGEEIAMGLPEEAEDAEAVVTDDGTVVYDTSEDVSVAVQATQELQGDLIIEGVRSMVVIDDADAPKEYAFNYDLPSGYEMVKSEDYYDNAEDAEKGWIYIVDQNSVYLDAETGEEFADIVAVIEPAWAKDADGKDINTYYRIRGSELIQVVEFDEDSRFPIVADPKTSSKPKNVKLWSSSASFSISHAALGIPSFSATTASKVLKKEIKERIAAKITAKVGTRVVPVLGTVMYIIDGYCFIQGLRGYSYTKGYFIYEKWKIYKRQASKWVAGYSYKVTDLSIWAE